jgi:hypothetical protein
VYQESIGNYGKVFLVNNNELFKSIENSGDMFPDGIHPSDAG